jgi:hypothetical protein
VSEGEAGRRRQANRCERLDAAGSKLHRRSNDRRYE